MDNWQFFMTRCLGSIENQTFKDYEIILTKAGFMAENTNRAILSAKGELIKVLYMDDYLFDENSLQEIVDNFGPYDEWLVTGCTHYDGTHYYNPHFATWNNQIQLGNNTIGSPSVMTIRNKSPLLFDEEMTWLLDCDYYKRMMIEKGPPKMLNILGVVIGTGPHQATNTMGETRKKQEEEYMKKKYDKN